MEATELQMFLESNNLLLVDRVALENFTRDAIADSIGKMNVWIDTAEVCRLLHTNRVTLQKMLEHPMCKIEVQKAPAKNAKKKYRLDTVLAERNRIKKSKG